MTIHAARAASTIDVDAHRQLAAAVVGMALQHVSGPNRAKAEAARKWLLNETARALWCDMALDHSFLLRVLRKRGLLSARTAA